MDNPPARAIAQAPAPLTSPNRPAAKQGWLQLFPPRVIEWNTIRLPIRDLPPEMAGLRFIHLSDFHFRRSWPAGYDRLLGLIRERMPDLVLITGDFVDNKRNHRPAMPMVRRLVEGLCARLGVFAIHGNHDCYAVGRELRDLPITFLDGKRTLVDTPGGPVELIGLPGLRRAQTSPRLLACFPARTPGVPRIVLSHFPDNIKRAGGLDADIFLAGHTHGGQICLPGQFPFLWHDSLPRRFAGGVHRIGSTWLVVSKGLGYTTLPARVFCLPDVGEVVLDVQDKTHNQLS